MGNAIELEGVTKSYGKIKAVNNCSLKVEKGEIFGIVGPNGAGKTTLIKLMTGQTKPKKGRVRVLNIDVLKNPERSRERTGIIPEQETPPSFLNSEEYLQFSTQIRELAGMTDKIREWMDFLDFKDEKNKLSKDLSRGTRQKLMISQAFFFEPELVFIDEPLVNLDPLIQKKMKEYLKHYAKKGGTVILSTHSLSLAQELCKRVAFIKSGEIVKVESVKKLKRKYGNLEEAFLKIIK